MEFVRHSIINDFEAITAGTVIDGKKEGLISISFKNTGTKNCTVNGFPLLPGDPMLSLGNEIPASDNTKYTIAFSGTGDALVYIIKTMIAESSELQTSKSCK